MKKVLLTITVAIAAVASSYGQGFVIFNNTSATKISTNSVAGGAATGTTSATAGLFYYALFYSAASTTANGSAAAVIPTAQSIGTYVWDDSGWTANNVLGANSTAGRFLSSSPNGDGSTTVNGVAGGGNAQYVVIGWSANIATTLLGLEAWVADPTFTAGQTYFLGESGVSGQLTAGNGGTIGNTALFGTASPFISPFTLGVVASVPEPTTMALAGLGAGALLLFRRRK